MNIFVSYQYVRNAYSLKPEERFDNDVIERHSPPVNMDDLNAITYQLETKHRGNSDDNYVVTILNYKVM